MKNIFILFLIIIVYKTFTRAYPFSRGGSEIQIIPHEFNGKVYDVVVIKTKRIPFFDPNEIDVRFDGPSGLTKKELATYIPSIVQTVQTWIINQYIQRGRIEPNSELHKALETTEKLMDGRSSIVFVTEHNDISQIKAVLRVSRSTQQLPELPLQSRLLQLGIKEELNLENHFYDKNEKIEFKNFIQAEKIEADFIPILFRAADAANFFDEGRALYDQGRPVKNSYGDIIISKPDVFVLECDQTMILYYKRMGFKLIQSYPKIDTYIFATDAPGIARISKRMEARPGNEIVKANRILTDQSFLPIRLPAPTCQSLFKSKQPFYIER